LERGVFFFSLFFLSVEGALCDLDKCRGCGTERGEGRGVVQRGWLLPSNDIWNSALSGQAPQCSYASGGTGESYGNWAGRSVGRTSRLTRR